MRRAVTPIGAASLLAVAVVGGCLGWWVVPLAACRLLRRARRRAQGEGCEPLWPELEGGGDAEASGAGVAPGRRGRTAALVASWLFALALLPLSPIETVLLGACGLAMATAALCDVEERLIPWETCVVLGAAGLAVQACSFGVEGVCAGVAAAVAIEVVCRAANAVLALRGRCGAGGGDVRCMAALSLASGRFAAAGLAVGCVAMALSGAWLRVVEKQGLGSPRPMAPSLAPWLACVALSCAYA